MKRVSLSLAIVLSMLGLPSPVKAQLSPTFSRPVVSVRMGGVQTVRNSTGGVAPYVEGQAMTHLGATPFGLALYGGSSYERTKETYRICPVAPPCFEVQNRHRYLDLATGLRFGAFSLFRVVDAFVGIASHFVHLKRTSDPLEGKEDWKHFSTVEGGVFVDIPVARPLSLTAGVFGFLPIRVGERPPPRDDPVGIGADMSRFGVQVGVQYKL